MGNMTVKTNDTTTVTNTNNNVYSAKSGEDIIGQLNEMMVNMGQLFGKLRDLLRQYQQAQQSNTFRMQVTAFDTRMSAIKDECTAQKNQAIGQIVGGGLQALGGGVGMKAPGLEVVGNSLSSATNGITGVAVVNGLTQQAKEQEVLAGYQQGLAEQQAKRSDETLDKALKVSSDLRDILSSLNQAYERIAGSVRLS